MRNRKLSRRATILLMVVGMLAMLFVILSAYVTLSRFDRLTITQFNRSKSIEEAIDSVQKVVMNLMVEQFAGPNGDPFAIIGDPGQPGVLPAGYNPTFEDLPGAEGARFQSGIEPFQDWSLGLPRTQRYSDWRYGAVSSTGPRNGSSSGNPSPVAGDRAPTFEQLVWTFGFGVTSTGGLAPRALMSDASNEEADWEYLSRNPEFDADGDGVPDSSFVHNLTLQEVVNAHSGEYGRAPEYYRNIALPPPPTATSDWDDETRRYFEQTRHTLSLRVVPHGGMISMYSPTAGGSPPSNRIFTDLMLRWGMQGYGTDVGKLPSATSGAGNAFYDRIASQRRSVESLIRRRGGMLATWRDYGVGAWNSTRVLDTTRVPTLMRELEEDFPNSFASTHNRLSASSGHPGAWQRFRMGDTVTPGGAERANWFSAVHLRPNRTNMSNYNRRKLLTAYNHSDELARRQVAPSGVQVTPTTREDDGLRLHQGQLKYYLGDFSDAVNAARNAFIIGGPDNFEFKSPYRAGGNVNDRRFIEQVASRYYNMLLGHAFPLYPGDPTAADYGECSVSRREQALMLAVNTVAFAAPRITSGPTAGFIDVVSYLDQQPIHDASPVDGTPDSPYRDQATGPGTWKVFAGYGPQPFLSQVQVQINLDTNNDQTYDPTAVPPVDVPQVAIGVELYNPNDPADATPTERHALYLGQFAIGVDGVDPNVAAEGAGWIRLGAGTLGPGVLNPLTGVADQRMPGRTFVALRLRNTGSGNTFFDSVPGISLMPDVSITKDVSKVQLWKQASYPVPGISGAGAAAWFMVDEVSFSNLESQFPSSAVYPGVLTYGVDVERDSTAQAYFGIGAGVGGRAARWGMVGAINEIVTVGSANPPTGVLGVPTLGATFAPVIPLPIMNTLPGLSFYNGAARPNAFPTTGFMHFIPRFAHTADIDPVTVVVSSYRPMAVALRNEWNIAGTGTTALTLTNYPADFGHMPVFNNTQNTSSGSYFTEKGRIPWGQLVYDYFTTIPMNDVPSTEWASDPLRIAGRININTAPWFVLSGLPLVDRFQLSANLSQLAVDAPPSFWSVEPGMMYGVDSGGQPRAQDVLENRPRAIPTKAPHEFPAGTWRLGDDLALAIAEYRDRGAYSPVGGFTYAYAYDRNQLSPPVVGGGAVAIYRDSAAYGAIRREITGGTQPRMGGFLSIGELMNVKGFDSQFAVAPVSDPLTSKDYLKAIGMMTMLDSHWLTTRSNTFTIYATITDRKDPSSSVRSQLTVDRSNCLPKLVTNALGDPVFDLFGNPVVVKGRDKPEIIGERMMGYVNAAFDD